MTPTAIDFQHTHSAHCESGVISSLLRHHGLDISEAMAFGLAGALTMAYLPMVKIGGMPLIGYRMPPKHILQKVTKRLGIKLHQETFSSKSAGMQALDKHLAAGQPVGMQTSVFWLPYFPEEMRFHFNAHNLVAYGKTDDDYLISDPTIEHPVICDAESLQRARFVKGMMSPKGLLYFPQEVPATVDLRMPLLSAIRANARMMVKTPLPILGTRGIRTLSKKIRSFAKDGDSKLRHNKLFVGHLVRMQEEIGTGGGGFRFLYASFLQEAAGVLQKPALSDISSQLTAAGDEWRVFALDAATMVKGRQTLDYNKLADQLLVCAKCEDSVFQELLQAVAKD